MAAKKSPTDLHEGERVRVRILARAPWGFAVEMLDVEPRAASIDVVRRGSEPGVQELLDSSPQVGDVITMRLGELIWYSDPPLLRVDLTADPDSTVTPRPNSD